VPFIRNLWIATLTRTPRHSGSKSKLVVIMNQNGLDVVHRDLGGSIETGGGRLYRSEISEQQVLPENYYMRIGIRGSDLWRPTVIGAWAERFTSGNVVTLGYDQEIGTILSSDSSEGRISLPLRQVGQGQVQTGINRVMMVTGTNVGVSGTNSPVNVRIIAGETVVVDHTIPDTPQDDFEAGEGNVYFLPVLSSFTRSQLTDSSIVLSIKGDDVWLPIVVVLFGLDVASGRPNAMVPLAHRHPWNFEPLSLDLSEGVESVTLPLAPLDP
jgi:hypothetical protein